VPRNGNHSPSRSFSLWVGACQQTRLKRCVFICCCYLVIWQEIRSLCSEACQLDLVTRLAYSAQTLTARLVSVVGAAILLAEFEDAGRDGGGITQPAGLQAPRGKHEIKQIAPGAGNSIPSSGGSRHHRHAHRPGDLAVLMGMLASPMVPVQQRLGSHTSASNGPALAARPVGVCGEPGAAGGGVVCAARRGLAGLFRPFGESPMLERVWVFLGQSVGGLQLSGAKTRILTCGRLRATGGNAASFDDPCRRGVYHCMRSGRVPLQRLPAARGSFRLFIPANCQSPGRSHLDRRRGIH
jgi:hypothetical protein